MADLPENVLGLDDEAFMKMDLTAFDEVEAEEEGESEEEQAEEEAVADSDDSSDEDETDDEGETDESDSDEDDSDKLDQEGSEESDGEGEENEGSDDEDSDNSGDPKSDGDAGDDKDSGPNHEDFYKKVTGEFKANGKMMKVENADDAIRLMQMGANYNRKMAALKPSMKMLKMLEKNELLDEGKLSYLIDLSQKNPKAIAKLLADSKIDPMDINLEGADDYQSADHSVDEREMNLDEVISDIKESEHYPRLIQTVSKQWDASSKQTVANEPQLLRVLNDHMALGIYDIVSTEIENERMLGRLNGVSDLEAYRIVGDAIAERGGFAHLNQSSDTGSQKQTPVKKVVTAGKKVADKQRKDKRRAASPSKATASQAKDQDFNPLALSDEEFEKQFNEKFL